MSAYEPGTVASATVRGVPNVMAVKSANARDYWLLPLGGPDRMTADVAYPGEVTDVRPRVVLDLANPKHYAADLTAAIEACGGRNSLVGANLADLRDQIEQQTRPPKPPEPTGLGAVVEARNGDRWVRIESGAPEADHVRLWVCEADEDARPTPWHKFDAVRVLSEGVRP